jgi:hypothetical protein
MTDWPYAHIKLMVGLSKAPNTKTLQRHHSEYGTRSKYCIGLEHATMTPRWNSALRISLMALFLAFAATTEHAAESPPSGAPGKQYEPTVSQRVARRDRIHLRQFGTRMVVEIYRVTGIGGMTLKPPIGGWPTAVVVHLHTFADLESFTARGADAALDCGLSRPEGIPPRPVCRLRGEMVDAIRRQPGRFEVTLPMILFESGNPVELQWVDQWR